MNQFVNQIYHFFSGDAVKRLSILIKNVIITAVDLKL